MLIKLKAHTGIEYINPEQIVNVSEMRGYVLMHLVGGGMLPIEPEEWERIEPMLVKPQSGLEASADDLTSSPSIDLSRPDIRAILSVPLGVTADEALAAIKQVTRGDIQIVKNWNGRVEFAISSIPLDEWLPDDEQPDDSDPDSEEL